MKLASFIELFDSFTYLRGVDLQWKFVNIIYNKRIMLAAKLIKFIFSSLGTFLCCTMFCYWLILLTGKSWERTDSLTYRTSNISYTLASYVLLNSLVILRKECKISPPKSKKKIKTYKWIVACRQTNNNDTRYRCLTFLN